MGDNDEFWISVEVTPEVELLTAADDSDVTFEDLPITDDQGGSGNTGVTVSVDSEGIPMCVPEDPMMVFENQSLKLNAWRTDDFGEFEFLGSDSLKVDPFPVGFDFGFPGLISYIGEEPSEMHRGWTNELQGVATDERDWYFTNKWGISRFSLSQSLGSSATDRIDLEDTPLRGLYNHFGDLDHYVKNHMGYLVVPLEGSEPSAIAFFGTHNFLYYIGYSVLPGPDGTGQDRAAWCAVDSEGNIYSSSALAGEDSTSMVHKYSFAWDELSAVMPPLVFEDSYNLLDERGQVLHLITIQGGDISDRGHLYTVNGFSEGGSSSGSFGVMAFKMGDDQNFHRFAYSMNQSGTGDFNFEFNPGSWRWEEPEGITISDLSNGVAPGIWGQIHVILLDNEWDDEFEDRDELVFKHYEVAEFERCKI